MNEPRSDALSPAGLQRRDAMLGALLREVDRTRTARRARRRAARMLGVVGITVLTVRFLLVPPLRPGEPRRSMVESIPLDSATPPSIGAHEAVPPGRYAVVSVVHDRHPVRVMLVESDPTIVQRYTAERPVHVVRKLDDRALLATLASIRRPAGLIRMGRRVRLSRPVSDAELALAGTPPRRYVR